MLLGAKLPDPRWQYAICEDGMYMELVPGGKWTRMDREILQVSDLTAMEEEYIGTSILDRTY